MIRRPALLPTSYPGSINLHVLTLHLHTQIFTLTYGDVTAHIAHTHTHKHRHRHDERTGSDWTVR